MKKTKIAIIGAGTIGTTVAYTLMLKHENVDVLLVNRTEKKAWGKSFDISHCLPDLPHRTIQSCSINDCVGADVLIITVGILPSPNGKRADMIKDNIKIFKCIIPILVKNNPHAVIVNVTNPVDAMAFALQKISKFPPERVIGTGTELDRMRLKKFMADTHHLDPCNIEIEIIGEHGDSMVPVWSAAKYKGVPLEDAVEGWGADKKKVLLEKTLQAGWDIRKSGEHSSYAISYHTVRIIERLMERSKDPILVSSLMKGEWGFSNVFMSLPTILGKNGVEKRLVPNLTKEEEEKALFSKEKLYDQLKVTDQFLSSTSA